MTVEGLFLDASIESFQRKYSERVLLAHVWAREIGLPPTKFLVKGDAVNFSGANFNDVGLLIGGLSEVVSNFRKYFSPRDLHGLKIFEIYSEVGSEETDVRNLFNAGVASGRKGLQVLLHASNFSKEHYGVEFKKPFEGGNERPGQEDLRLLRPAIFNSHNEESLNGHTILALSQVYPSNTDLGYLDSSRKVLERKIVSGKVIEVKKSVPNGDFDTVVVETIDGVS